MEIKITANNFNEIITNAKTPILIDFWATWCGPCRMLAPELEKVAEKYQDKVTVGKVNVDEEEQLAFEFKVSSIPMLVLINDGKIIATSIGYTPASGIEAFLQKNGVL